MADNTTWHRDEETGQYVFDTFVVVNAPVEKCFAAWENFEMFPSLFSYITEVRRTGDNNWHWAATIGGQHADWDAGMTDFHRNDIIAWESTDGLRNSGSVTFSPEDDGRRCRISVHLMYDPPYGVIGDLVAQYRFNDEFYNDLVRDLLNFKENVESGRTDYYRAA